MLFPVEAWSARPLFPDASRLLKWFFKKCPLQLPKFKIGSSSLVLASEERRWPQAL